MQVKPQCLLESKQAINLHFFLTASIPSSALDNCLQCLAAVLKVETKHLRLHLSLHQGFCCLPLCAPDTAWEQIFCSTLQGCWRG